MLSAAFLLLSAYALWDKPLTIPEIELYHITVDTLSSDSDTSTRFQDLDSSLVIRTDTITEIDTLIENHYTLYLDTLITIDTIYRNYILPNNREEIDTIINIDTTLRFRLHTERELIPRTRQRIVIDTVPRHLAGGHIDTTKQRILLIGDSMLEGLRMRLIDYCEYNGHDLDVVIWYSAQTYWYGKYDTLSYFINKHDPSYVILVLGANELFVRDIKTKRQKYVDHILKQIGQHRFVWVGPPNWADDTGINEMIVENVGKRRYFPSKDLSYKRASDGAHPTMESARMWMDSISTWIMNESMYPIKLEEPPPDFKREQRYPNTELLQPLR